MRRLDSHAKYQLDPEIPRPVKVALDECADHRTDAGTSDRRKNNESNSVLLMISFE